MGVVDVDGLHSSCTVAARTVRLFEQEKLLVLAIDQQQCVLAAR
jgi:hypothetical protein